MNSNQVKGPFFFKLILIDILANFIIYLFLYKFRNGLQVYFDGQTSVTTLVIPFIVSTFLHLFVEDFGVMLGRSKWHKFFKKVTSFIVLEALCVSLIVFLFKQKELSRFVYLLTLFIFYFYFLVSRICLHYFSNRISKNKSYKKIISIEDLNVETLSLKELEAVYLKLPNSLTPFHLTPIEINQEILLKIQRPELNESQKIIKRTLDIIISLGALILCLPFLIPVILLIIIETKTNPIYVQKRTGKFGKNFYMLKLRTMHNTLTQKELSNDINGPLFKNSNDPRITVFGKFLRKTSLDEWPQFINVLKGDMSIVGPRPPTPEEVSAYQDEFYEKLTVSPGITGLWQVTERKNTTNFLEMFNQDLEYIKNYDLLLDLEIMARTIWVMISFQGK